MDRFSESISNGLKRILDHQPRAPLRLVVGLNRVDEMVPGGWDVKLNLPTAEAARQIQRKCEYTRLKLASATNIGRNHIEYYSALKRYRLHDLLNRVILHCYAGFKFSDVQPLNFEDVVGVDPDARRFTKEQRALRMGGKPEERASARDRLFAELSRIMSADDLKDLEAKFTAEMKRTPKVAVLGQSGVGKTTTVNALFATEWRTSAVEVGTHEAQEREVTLPSGGTIDVIDLPGYGRSLRDDERYRKIYEKVIPDCDLVLLIIQADRGDLADDQEMITALKKMTAGAPAAHV